MRNQTGTTRGLAVLLLVIFCLAAQRVDAQSTGFTYQGKLTDNSLPANGTYDFQFTLFDAVSGGVQQGSTVALPAVQVTAGVFTVQLDFGTSVFPGANRFLEIAVKQPVNPTYTTLSPRQPVTSTPYTIRSLNAATADGLSAACVNCVTSSQIQNVQGTQVTGTIPVASVPAGSASYIQNTTNQQTASNFNVSGDGTVGGTLSGNAVNATTQYNIAGLPVLSAGFNNLFAGINAGTNNLSAPNTFVGYEAGFSNTFGSVNSFFGAWAGNSNTTGDDNSFFGHDAGFSNTTGVSNSFFGTAAGGDNSTGFGNSFFGVQAGDSNTTGSGNSLFGLGAGFRTSTGSNNTFIGNGADFNIFNPNGSKNTLLGANTTVNSNVNNGTAIGADASVTQSNSLVLGSINNINGATSDTLVGIGTTAPKTRLDVVDPTTQIRFGPSSADSGGYLVSTGPSQAIIAGGARWNGFNWVAKSTTAVLTDEGNGQVVFYADTGLSAGSIFSPTPRVFINNSGNILDVLGPAHASSFPTSSDARLKMNVAQLKNVLDKIEKIRGVTFDWNDTYKSLGRSTGHREMGVVAQEIEAVFPELVTRWGEEGYRAVDYGRLTAALIEAVKELRAEKDAQAKQLRAEKDEQVNSLRNQNAALNARLTVLEQMMRKVDRPKKRRKASK